MIMRKFLVSFNYCTRDSNGVGNVIVGLQRLTEESVKIIERNIRSDNGFDTCVIISITELEG